MDISSYIKAIHEEEHRNAEFLHLTANEAQLSHTASQFLGTKLSERYYFGASKDNVADFGVFTALGLPSTHALIEKGEEAAKRMLGAVAVNLHCLSGVHAMMCAILSTTEPGDTVLTVHHDHGGHFATEGILARVGRKHAFVSYDLEHLRFDVQETAKTFRKTKAKAIYLDVSYYINPHNLRELREAVGPKALIIYDASHTMGLIMGQQFQAPLKEGASVVCANTHKTLPGPQKGMIAFCDQELADKANKIINGCLYSSPHTHHMIMLAITLLELEAFGKEYAEQVIKNSNAIAEAFVKLGYNVRKSNTGRYSENHQAHIFIDDKGERLLLYKHLLQNNISTNFDNVLGHRLFIRIGTQELTRRGMKEKDMQTVAKLMDQSMKGKDVKKDVVSFTQAFPDILFSFDR
ncbi:MAG TPA: hypothetical protein DCX25_01065 [Candidatus Pacebacteria bacterium]|nr:MAG: Serine hydroxymethyltransferase [Microgenomates group bacterium GW2011_GWB1_45_17]KKU23562.1 MAG: Serine hydroxymethyltransferase [Microgenomates group bacterium GW2011_GWC1_46_15]KKU24281.1 MAG: Serine hydroxymethyltransferase [Microgenomates group bacterium GW2011_GWA1_46_15]HAV14899.1 hypothetical protein [Candidatus Paceibacterota bacterium]HCR11350.1 hypothetical protein [Candidatus Paceibacterota bacterium]